MSEEIINNSEEVVAEAVTPETVSEAPVVAEVAAEAVAEVAPVVAEAPVVAAETTPVAAAPTSRYAGNSRTGGRPPFNKNGRTGGRPPRAPREKPEFDSKAIDVRRVTRVTSGGRRFSLHVTMIAGDRNGRVGLGVGKALDTQVAMEKAMKSARKNMIKFNLDDKKTIKHEVSAKFDTAEVWISPNKEKGLIAGSSARVILNLAGLQNVTAKFHGGTKNKLNNARATMKALASVSTRA